MGSETEETTKLVQNSLTTGEDASTPGDTTGGVVTRDQIIEVLKTIEDPELFLDIWFLGLIYNIDIERTEDQQSKVKVEMTFTSPMCPAGPLLIDKVKTGIQALAGVKEVEVKIVFNPPWQPSDEVKALLGLI
jgi:metal-sulfur cluster biosynthetic enzyme